MHANADDLIGEPPMGAAEDRFEVAQIGGMDFRGHLHPACPDHGMEKNRCTQTPMNLIEKPMHASAVSGGMDFRGHLHLRWVRRRTGSSYNLHDSAKTNFVIGKRALEFVECRYVRLLCTECRETACLTVEVVLALRTCAPVFFARTWRFSA